MIGAAELQKLAETYNSVYRENQEAQKLIRHEAEYDALTELLNRRFEVLIMCAGSAEMNLPLLWWR